MLLTKKSSEVEAEGVASVAVRDDGGDTPVLHYNGNLAKYTENHDRLSLVYNPAGSSVTGP
jgi:hypothetical protein